MLDNLSLLFRFIAIVENGTLRGAAERLNVTQPALSRSLAMLKSTTDKSWSKDDPAELFQRHLAIRFCQPRRGSKRLGDLEDQLHEGETGTIGTLRIQAGPLWRSVVLPA